MSLLIVARSDSSGLGVQTRNLTYMLRPDKVLVIDSTPFNGHEQHFEWYENFNHEKTYGYPRNDQLRFMLDDITHVLVCETPMNHNLFKMCKARGIKSYLVGNYEFLDFIRSDVPLPDQLIMPSTWNIEKIADKNPVVIPTPIFPNDFKEARKTNFNRSGRKRFLHVVGKLATNDRNGTNELLQALQHTTRDFELVIKSQHPLDIDIQDERVRLDTRNAPTEQDLYRDFDALIFPRRYGGQSLVVNEALLSGLPVIMPRISPNEFLNPHWLVDAVPKEIFQAKTEVQTYSVIPEKLAQRIDWLVDTDLSQQKILAFATGHQFSDSVIKKKYEDLFA